MRCFLFGEAEVAAHIEESANRQLQAASLDHLDIRRAGVAEIEANFLRANLNIERSATGGSIVGHRRARLIDPNTDRAVENEIVDTDETHVASTGQSVGSRAL